MASYATPGQLAARLPQVTIDAASTVLLSACLAGATGIVRDALRAALADSWFDFAAYGAASTRIVAGYGGPYLRLAAHQAGSVTLVEYLTTWNPVAYAAVADPWLEEAGRLYRPSGWGLERYRITAAWGYGPPPAAIEELTLELAVNIWRSRDKGGYTEIVGVEGAGGIRMIAGLNTQQEATIRNVAAQLWEPSV